MHKRTWWAIAVACLFVGLFLWGFLSTLAVMELSTALLILGLLLYYLWAVANVRKESPPPKPQFTDGYKGYLPVAYMRATHNRRTK